MCGITGAAWTAAAAPLDLSVLGLMTMALEHRGPDDVGYYHSAISSDREARDLSQLAARSAEAGLASGPGAALGFRRLSIIDLAGGHQPLSNEDGTIWIAFNGEIYNYRELQLALERQGHRFRTTSDTETIVHLYEQYGTDCVSHLRGMFAFALWDNSRRQLFLARDRLGKKPLVYRLEPDRLLFGSELKALLTVPGLPRDVDPIALNDYLTYQYVPHPLSILKGFRKLPPGHLGLYHDGQWQVHRYWAPAFAKPQAQAEAMTQARDKLRHTLTDAVRLRMRSDVPLGAFLSGGIDSTIVVGLMQQLSERPVKTFSIGFPVKAFDERSYGRLAAEHLKTEHHEQVVEPSALAILPKLIAQYDEPFADSSAIPTMYLSEMTRRHVTVALSGDGGDELFAGYERYRAVYLAQWFDILPRPLRKCIAASAWQKLPASTRQKSKRRRLKRLLSALAYPPERRYLKWVSIFDDARLPGLWSDGFRERLGNADPAEFLLAAYRECPSRDFTTRTTCADVLTYLPCDILNKVDIASMTYGLEVRCPLLDQEVVDLAAAMPLEFKMRRGKGKQILIETFADLLPPAIQQRAKMGFGVPLDHWFRGELAPMLKEVLLDRSSLGRGLFRPQAIEQLVTEHVTSRWDHSYRLWALLVLELWQKKYLDHQ
jgi:asparagine synthase (glutamine-hydrolysing)